METPDEIADVLRERIIVGRYRAGTPLTQRPLADQLGVSRAAIAEALRVLRREGLVAREGTAGHMRVVVTAPELVASAYVMREVLDGAAARLSAQGVPGPTFEETCRIAIDDQRSALAPVPERIGYARASAAFHTTLIDGAGSPLLRQYIPMVRATTWRVALLEPEQLQAGITEHEAILAAVCAGDQERAEEVARAHARATGQALAHAAAHYRAGEGQ